MPLLPQLQQEVAVAASWVPVCAVMTMKQAQAKACGSRRNHGWDDGPGPSAGAAGLQRCGVRAWV